MQVEDIQPLSRVFLILKSLLSLYLSLSSSDDKFRDKKRLSLEK